jgi:hypothetical protein
MRPGVHKRLLTREAQLSIPDIPLDLRRRLPWQVLAIQVGAFGFIAAFAVLCFLFPEN